MHVTLPSFSLELLTDHQAGAMSGGLRRRSVGTTDRCSTESMQPCFGSCTIYIVYDGLQAQRTTALHAGGTYGRSQSGFFTADNVVWGTCCTRVTWPRPVIYCFDAYCVSVGDPVGSAGQQRYSNSNISCSSIDGSQAGFPKRLYASGPMSEMQPRGRTQRGSSSLP